LNIFIISLLPERELIPGMIASSKNNKWGVHSAKGVSKKYNTENTFSENDLLLTHTDPSVEKLACQN
jgi:hypothetical protein